MTTKKLTTLTKEQVADFTALADALKAVSDAKEIKDAIAGKHKEFIDEWENQLRAGVKIGNLRLRVKISRQFVAERA